MHAISPEVLWYIIENQESVKAEESIAQYYLCFAQSKFL